jgi:hypothetical protein
VGAKQSGVNDLMTIAQAQKEFALGRMTLYRAIQTGRLKKYRRGIGDRRTYLSRQTIKQLVAFKEEK